jgi:pentatricopeptide repeat protein
MGHLFCIILLAHLALTFAFLKSRVSRKLCQLKFSASERYTQNEKIDFDAAIRQCRYSNDFSPAIKLAEKALLLRPMPSSLLTGVIKVFGEANQLGRAVSLFRVMKEEMSIAPNEYHLSALIVACRRCGQWEMAVALYNRTDSLGIKKNTVICNGIISVLGDALQWETVFSILNEMDAAGIKKDIVTYSAAITAFSKAGEWQHAIEMYRLMSISGITPNTITFNSVLSACVRGRQVKMALDLFSEASSRGIVLDTISYSVVIKVCGEMNEFDLALKIFNAMEEKRLDSSPAAVANSAFTSNVLPLPLPVSITTPITLVDQQKDYLTLITSGWNSSSSSQFSTDYVKGLISSCIVVRRDTGCFNAMITSCERAGIATAA